MKAAPSHARKCWTYVQQQGVCYLQLTSLCRRAHGLMALTDGQSNGRITDTRYATWEHLIPRGQPMPVKVKRNECILLACYACNHIKAAQHIATREQIDFAMLLAGVWHRIGSGLDEQMAFVRMNAPSKMVEGSRVIDMALPVVNAPPITGDVVRSRDAAPCKRERPPLEREIDRTPHPRLPAAGYDKPLSVRLREEAEARRAEVQREHANNRLLSENARGILAAVRGGR